MTSVHNPDGRPNSWWIHNSLLRCIDEPVFVPAHRLVPLGGPFPELAARTDRGSYGVPVPSLIPWTLARRSAQ